jgi:alanyl-tRNA synthetase
LAHRNVDTGMGVERTVSALNGYKSVYDVEGLRELVECFRSNSRGHGPAFERALRIIADHMRAAVFILGDEKDVKPSNSQQGYVLRRLLRRMIRYMSQFQIDMDLMPTAVAHVIRAYSRAYPELSAAENKIIDDILAENRRFARTLDKGLGILGQTIEVAKQNNEGSISAEAAFRLYETHGFPLEFTQEILRENGLSVDAEAFDKLMEQHREISKTVTAKGGLADQSEEAVNYHTATHLLRAELSNVLGTEIVQKGSNITSERMRFDFGFSRALTKSELEEVERRVNQDIVADLPVTYETMDYSTAVTAGVVGAFVDRYHEKVKVYRIGELSAEMCGGPHAESTGPLGHFVILKEQSAGAGIRRIRAVLKGGLH